MKLVSFQSSSYTMIHKVNQAPAAMKTRKTGPAGDKSLRRVFSSMLLILLVFALPQNAIAAGKKKSSTSDNPKYASIVIDASTGAILSERYPDKVVHPASLTKVMTLLLLFEALENGNVRLNDKILISANAANEQPSKLGLGAGASIRVEDAILAVVTKSANDIATAIGEHLAGSESRFALRMTRRAHDIGMNRTTFKNAHGLHNPLQVTSARDMATLARYILVRYPNYYRYFGTKQFTYRGKTYTNHNRLMQSYPGMDGFKTGFINASGFNLIASSKQNGKRIIGVVFGGRSWKSRNDHMAGLLNTGFAKLPEVRMAAKAPAPRVVAAAKPMPMPAVKPVYRETNGAQGTGTLQLPPSHMAQNSGQPHALVQGIAPQAPPQGQDYASLSALSSDQQRRVVIPAPAIPAPQPDVAEQAAANARAAVNRGDYSELTGEGDYDSATARRVETGLLAAAVYKGEHERARQIQSASAAAANAAPVPPVPPQGTTGYLPAALPPETLPASDLWSVQIGAYTSRVATDDALRLAHSKLPPMLTHASPIVVPLKTAQGILFRARLGGFSKAEADSACLHFRDCLPIPPR